MKKKLYKITNVTLALSALASLPAVGQEFIETHKLLPADGARDDHFGESISLSGSIAIIGSPGDDDFGAGSGSAYIYSISIGHQLFKLLPSDGSAHDLFGGSVAISGTKAIVGSRFDDDNGLNSGSAYIFDTTTGQQLFKLLPSDGAPGDTFGRDVAISGTTAIIGSSDQNINSVTGSAYLFDTNSGQQLFKLLPSDGAPGDIFGGSVAISGTTAIVGSQNDDDNGASSGSIYLFDTTTGQQLYKLLPSDGAALDLFGFSVAISGTTAIVGAYRDDDNGENSGSAYLFDTSTGQQLYKLLPSDGAAGDSFGRSVAISGTTAIVGAYRDDDNGFESGSAYLFDTTTGQQIAKILPSDGAPGDSFGTSVAIIATTAFVGAESDDDNGLNSGSAYLFTAPSPCTPDLTNDGTLNFFDVSAFLTAYAANDPAADFNADGQFNFFDVSAFLTAYLAGCP